MDPFRTCLALGPLALYLLVLGAISLRRRPFVVSGPRDTAALGVGLSGLVLVGPIELLMPRDALAQFGVYAWIVLGVMYSLAVTMLVLLGRPRIVAYNATPADVRTALAHALPQLDPDARWVGNSLVLPRLHVELHLEAGFGGRNVSLVAANDEQDYTGWRQLEIALAHRLRPIEGRGGWAAGLLGAGLALLGVVVWELTCHTADVARGFHDMLRL